MACAVAGQGGTVHTFRMRRMNHCQAAPPAAGFGVTKAAVTGGGPWASSRGSR